MLSLQPTTLLHSSVTTFVDTHEGWVVVAHPGTVVLKDIHTYNYLSLDNTVGGLDPSFFLTNLGVLT